MPGDMKIRNGDVCAADRGVNRKNIHVIKKSFHHTGSSVIGH